MKIYDEQFAISCQKLQSRPTILEVMISLWYGYEETWKKTCLEQSEWVSRGLSKEDSWSEGAESRSKPIIKFGFAFR